MTKQTDESLLMSMALPCNDGFTHGERRRSAVADVVQAWRRGRACGARQEIASALWASQGQEIASLRSQWRQDAMTKDCNDGDQRGSFTKPAAKAVPVKIIAAHRITQVVMTSFKKAMPIMLANSGIKYVTVMVRDAPTLAIKRKYST